MGTKSRMRLKFLQHAKNVVGRGFKSFRRLAVQRNMEMNPPFTTGKRLLRQWAREGHIEIFETNQRTIRLPPDDLVQIDVFLKRSELGQRGWRGTKFESIADVNFTEANLVVPKSRYCLLRFLELNSEVAGIIIHS